MSLISRNQITHSRRRKESNASEKILQHVYGGIKLIPNSKISFQPFERNISTSIGANLISVRRCRNLTAKQAAHLLRIKLQLTTATNPG